MSSIDWVPINQFAVESGMSKSVVAGHVGVGGDWPEGDVWLKLANHSILISKSGYNKWLEMVAASVKRRRHPTKSNLPITANGAGSVSSSSPAPLTGEQ